MKKKMMICVAAVAALCLTLGCKAESPKSAQVSTPAARAAAPAGIQNLAPPPGAGFQGSVVDTINAAGYTYVQVDTGAKTIWAATNAFEVKVGDTVAIPQGIPMRNYHSKTLERTFDLVYFVNRISVGAASAAAPAPQGHPPMGGDGTQASASAPQGHPPMGGSRAKASAPADIDFSDLQKPEGAKTVAELYAGRKELAGKTVTVHGKVVKFSPNILKRNWIHIQDGTGEQGKNDLVVTSKDRAQVGDTVTATGLVKADPDFGYGYRYELVLSEAQLVAQ